MKNSCTSYIYFISVGDGIVKIGKSDNPIGRMKHFQSSNPFIKGRENLKAVLKVPWESVMDVERDLHIFFEKKNMHGPTYTISHKEWKQMNRDGNLLSRTTYKGPRELFRITDRSIKLRINRLLKEDQSISLIYGWCSLYEDPKEKKL